METAQEPARIDHWLKLVCVFKHRSAAAAACEGGHVKINGNRAKPATRVRPGDLVELTEPRIRKLVVLGLPASSISKEAAREMYRDETPQEEARPPRAPVTREAGAGRPTKKERREIDKWKW